MNAAVIVETRNLEGLTELIRKHMKHLPDWELVIFGSKENVSLMDDFDCTFYILPKDLNNEGYNRLLTNSEFWNKLIKYNRVLLFQHDSMILRPGIGEFVSYDYVGSPWAVGAPWSRNDRKGGNGGFSLRNPQKMLDLLKIERWHPAIGNEDVFYVHNLEKVGAKIAPYEVCKLFGCEAEFQMDTFGYHAIDKHLTNQEIDLILNQYANSVTTT